VVQTDDLGQGLFIAWNYHVPDQVIDTGPYAHIRHPIYLSYLFAFLAPEYASYKARTGRFIPNHLRY
jgi:protein-S-isoprenylcysteine O-methyltransferase Ste14